MQNIANLKSHININILDKSGKPLYESSETFKGVGHELDSHITEHLKTNQKIDFVLGDSIDMSSNDLEEIKYYQILEPPWASNMKIKITTSKIKNKNENQDFINEKIVYLKKTINEQNVFSKKNNIDKFLKIYLFGRFYYKDGTRNVFVLTEDIVPIKEFLNDKSYEIVLATVKEVVKAVSLLHNYGFLHLDINYRNIMCRKSDGSIVLTDFGKCVKIEDYKGEKWKEFINHYSINHPNFNDNLNMDMKNIIDSEEKKKQQIKRHHSDFLTIIHKFQGFNKFYTSYELVNGIVGYLELIPTSTFLIYKAMAFTKKNINLLKKLDIWNIGLFMYDILYHPLPFDNNTLTNDLMMEEGNNNQSSYKGYMWMEHYKYKIIEEIIERKKDPEFEKLSDIEQQPTLLLKVLKKQNEAAPNNKDPFFIRLESLMNKLLLYDYTKRPYSEEVIDSFEAMRPMEINSDSPIKGFNLTNSPFGKGRVSQNAGKPKRKSKKSKRKSKKTTNKTSNKTRKTRNKYTK